MALLLFTPANYPKLFEDGGRLKPSDWYGYLPPISLVAFIVAMFVMLEKFLREGANPDAED